MTVENLNASITANPEMTRKLDLQEIASEGVLEYIHDQIGDDWGIATPAEVLGVLEMAKARYIRDCFSG